MLTRLNTRPALAMTASVVAIGVALAIYPALEQVKTAPQATPAPLNAAKQDKTTAANAPKKEALPFAKDARARDELRSTESAQVPQAAPPLEADNAPSTSLAQEVAPTAPALSGQPLGRIATGNDAATDRSFAAAPADGTGGFAEPVMEPEILMPAPAPDTEAFANAETNPVKIAAEDPVSTFSADVDTASWSVLRSSLTAGMLPPPDAVRIEEMVNYFPYDYPAPEPGGAPFRASVNLFPTPWNAGTMLLRVGLQGELPSLADRPPLNLVFLIDTSGSMDDPAKLPLLKQSFRLMLGQLRPEDRVAIVTYAGSAGLVLGPTDAADRTTILAALDRLDAGGSTAGQEGLQQAYATAETMAEDGRIGRILLATDGDFNVGIQDPEELKDFIAKKREGGTYLSVLGFGRGNLDDATMQALAQNGNGTAAYIDTLSEAQKVLVDQLSGALFPIADDVKIQIEFNPAAVAEYRLIGYETRALAREDFNNDKVDAGEIGAGHQVTALYEITPPDSAARLSDPLRYATGESGGNPDELGFLKLRYKAPGTAVSTLIETPIPATPAAADDDARFAAAVAGMGQLLGTPKYLHDWGWEDAIALANGARGTDPFGYRAEAVQLMRLARSLSR